MYPLQYLISRNDLVAFVRPTCPYCQRLQQLLSRLQMRPTYINIETLSPAEIADIQSASGSATWPQVWHKQQFIGGYDDSAAYAW